MRLRTKLMIPPVSTALMLVFVLAVALWVLDSFRERSHASQGEMISEYARVSGLQSQLSDAHIDLYRTMAVINLLGDKKIKETRDQRARLMGGIAESAKAGSAATQAGMLLSKSLHVFAQQVGRYAKSSDTAIDLSTESPNAQAMKKADEDYRALNGSLSEVIALVQARSTHESAQLASDALRNAVMVGLLGLLAAGASIVFAWINQRRINGQVQSAGQAAERVADGQLDLLPQSAHQDEIGDLVRSLGTMVSRLRDSIEAVQHASESVRVASGEIAAGNLDFSQRTEQTASNLQQVASSMARLTGAVRESADSARQANQLASSAAEVAARGGVIVSQVTQTMDEIGADSREIGDIVGVIDGIAAQTNILALNAAVEAARAGESGRGFAVVAEEVRALAGRSAAAAKQVKDLIGASVDKVESGTRLVADAGVTMLEIVNSVQHVSDIVAQITAAAHEQSEGIGQVNTSVAQLDRMTQQNAALVEQGAAAAESLKDQAGRLANVVSLFKLQACAAATPAPASGSESTG